MMKARNLEAVYIYIYIVRSNKRLIKHRRKSMYFDEN